MKNLILLFVAVCLFSCSKDDEKPTNVYQEENPLDQFIINSGFNGSIVSSAQTITSFYELGFTFRPLVKGKINAIVIKLPLVKSSIRVTIWDLEAQIPIRTETVNVSSAAIAITKEIMPLELIANKEYVISMNSNTAFLYNSNFLNPVNANYPIIVGNISISETNYSPTATTSQVFPIGILFNKYSGYCSFKFQQTD